MASGPITSWQIDREKVETVTDFMSCKIITDSDCSHEIKRYLLLGRKSMTNLDIVLKSRDITLPTKVRLVKVISSSHVWCESWTKKRAECWRIAAFKLCCWRRLLRVPWTARRSNQSTFTGKTDAEAETPVLWLPVAKSLLIGKDSDAGKDWKQKEKRETEDKMVGWHHWLHGYEFEQTLGNSEGQRSLACCSSGTERPQWRTIARQQG